MKDQADPISAEELETRHRRVMSISVDLGFVGSVEYRHVYSRSGGAQYGIGPSADDDIMVLYAEAFERDADPADFNLEALIAHECGHQRLHRDQKQIARHQLFRVLKISRARWLARVQHFQQLLDGTQFGLDSLEKEAEDNAGMNSMSDRGCTTR